jgi:hypothetical protein
LIFVFCDIFLVEQSRWPARPGPRIIQINKLAKDINIVRRRLCRWRKVLKGIEEVSLKQLIIHFWLCPILFLFENIVFFFLVIKYLPRLRTSQGSRTVSPTLTFTVWLGLLSCGWGIGLPEIAGATAGFPYDSRNKEEKKMVN